MKKAVLLGVYVILLAACVRDIQPSQIAQAENAIGMANPASVFCEQQGGQSINRKNADGSEYGVCVFADSR